MPSGFSSPNAFRVGQIVWCNHRNSHIDETANSGSGIQDTDKVRPCLIVDVDRVNRKISLAPFTTFDKHPTHAGWQPIGPIDIGFPELKPLIWVGRPAVTNMILQDSRGTMYINSAQRSVSKGPISQANIKYYELLRASYIGQFGVDHPADSQPSRGQGKKFQNVHTAGTSQRQSYLPTPSNHYDVSVIELSTSRTERIRPKPQHASSSTPGFRAPQYPTSLPPNFDMGYHHGPSPFQPQQDTNAPLSTLGFLAPQYPTSLPLQDGPNLGQMGYQNVQSPFQHPQQATNAHYPATTYTQGFGGNANPYIAGPLYNAAPGWGAGQFPVQAALPPTIPTRMDQQGRTWYLHANGEWVLLQ
ncbi:hypothetical protein FB451DRAFT_1265057 [Mycena latifolia]|nr:hypothetical protein FB451DRAFT_1265057 [Mycena latifolia]